MAKNIIFTIVIFSLPVLFIYYIDAYIGTIYKDIAPEFGRKNLALALRHYNGKVSRLRLTPHPYLTYENTPNYIRKGVRQHNNMGYRNSADTELLKAPLTIRILALGGSTTYGTGVSKPEDAWPEQLQTMINQSLSSNSNYKVEVINAGLPWGSSAELLNHYIFRDRYLNPDIVILHTGGNDMGPLKHDNYTPEYTHWRSIKSGSGNFLRPGEAHIIRASNIIKLLYSYWYQNIGYATKSAYIHTKGSATLTNEQAANNIANNMPVGFSRNLSLLIRNIKQDGAIPVYFQFYWPGEELFSDKAGPALIKANKAVNFTELFDAHRQALNKNETAAKSVSENKNIEYIEIERNAIPVEYLVDQCHLNHDGQEFKASFMNKRIFPYLERLLYVKSKNN